MINENIQALLMKLIECVFLAGKMEGCVSGDFTQKQAFKMPFSH